MDTVTENITLISKTMKNMNKNLPGKPRPLMRRLSSLQEMVCVTKAHNKRISAIILQYLLTCASNALKM